MEELIAEKISTKEASLTATFEEKAKVVEEERERNAQKLIESDQKLKQTQQLLDEAAAGKSSMLTIGFHLRITGRPARFRAVAAILDHLAKFEGQIWRARRIDIARHFTATTALSSNQKLIQQGDRR